MKCLEHFVIEAEGFKFGVLGLLVAVFLQLKHCFSCRLSLKKKFYIIEIGEYKHHSLPPKLGVMHKEIRVLSRIKKIMKTNVSYVPLPHII